MPSTTTIYRTEDFLPFIKKFGENLFNQKTLSIESYLISILPQIKDFEKAQEFFNIYKPINFNKKLISSKDLLKKINEIPEDITKIINSYEMNHISNKVMDQLKKIDEDRKQAWFYQPITDPVFKEFGLYHPERLSSVKFKEVLQDKEIKDSLKKDIQFIFEKVYNKNYDKGSSFLSKELIFFKTFFDFIYFIEKYRNLYLKVYEQVTVYDNVDESIKNIINENNDYLLKFFIFNRLFESFLASTKKFMLSFEDANASDFDNFFIKLEKELNVTNLLTRKKSKIIADFYLNFINSFYHYFMTLTPKYTSQATKSIIIDRNNIYIDTKQNKFCFNSVYTIKKNKTEQELEKYNIFDTDKFFIFQNELEYKLMLNKFKNDIAKNNFNIAKLNIFLKALKFNFYEKFIRLLSNYSDNASNFKEIEKSFSVAVNRYVEIILLLIDSSSDLKHLFKYVSFLFHTSKTQIYNNPLIKVLNIYLKIKITNYVFKKYNKYTLYFNKFEAYQIYNLQQNPNKFNLLLWKNLTESKEIDDFLNVIKSFNKNPQIGKIIFETVFEPQSITNSSKYWLANLGKKLYVSLQDSILYFDKKKKITENQKLKLILTVINFKQRLQNYNFNKALEKTNFNEFIDSKIDKNDLVVNLANDEVFLVVKLNSLLLTDTKFKKWFQEYYEETEIQLVQLYLKEIEKIINKYKEIDKDFYNLYKSIEI